MPNKQAFLHTMIRVGNLERSLAFYTNLLGMKEIRRTDVPEGKYTLVYIGYDTEANGATEIELTYNYGVEKYDLGTAFGHFAVSVADIHATAERLRAAGARITREPGPVKFGTTLIAFVEDPDGYKIELIQRG